MKNTDEKNFKAMGFRAIPVKSPMLTLELMRRQRGLTMEAVVEYAQIAYTTLHKVEHPCVGKKTSVKIVEKLLNFYSIFGPVSAEERARVYSEIAASEQNKDGENDSSTS